MFDPGRGEIVYFQGELEHPRLRTYRHTLSDTFFVDTRLDPYVRFAPLNPIPRDRYLDYYPDSLRKRVSGIVEVGDYAVTLLNAYLLGDQTVALLEYDRPQDLLLLRKSEGRYNVIALYPEALAYKLYAGASISRLGGDTIIVAKDGGDEEVAFETQKRLLVRGDSLRLVGATEVYRRVPFLALDNPVPGATSEMIWNTSFPVQGDPVRTLEFDARIKDQPVVRRARTDSLVLYEVVWCDAQSQGPCWKGIREDPQPVDVIHPGETPLRLGMCVEFNSYSCSGFVAVEWKNRWFLARTEAFQRE